MLSSVQAPVDAEGVAGKLSLPDRGAQQPGHEIDFASRFAERGVRQHGALVEVTDQMAQGADVVGEAAFATGPDDEEGEGEEGGEEDEGDVAGHAGGHADGLGGHIELGGEDAAGEDGNGAAVDGGK